MVDYAHFAPGQIFARRYQVVHLVKAGGMGAVYEATHLSTRRRVALKVMRPEIVVDANERARFVQEAQVATIIESGHVVDVLDAGVDEETHVPFLIMEFLVGEELGDHLKRRGKLPPQEVVHWLAQAARALDKAHARGVIHRDLKPENMFLATRDEGTTLKILDFGIAKVLQSAQATSTRGAGTPLYMAPEQTRRSSKIGPPTDVWALGLIAYKLLVGKNYWLAEDVHQLLGEILVEAMESPTQRAAMAGVALPPTFDGWFFACVNRDPSSRYRTAGEAVAALAAVFGLEAPHVSSPPMDLSPTPGIAATVPQTQSSDAIALAQTTAAPNTNDPVRAIPTRSTTPLVVGGVIVAALVGVGAWQLMKTRENKPIPAPAPVASTNPSTPASASADPRDELGKKIAASNPFVKVRSLNVQRHEVTRDEFATYLGSLPPHERPKARPLADWSGEPVDDATAKHPVTWVSYELSTRFCAAIGARLPTSDEWTRALEGTDFLAGFPKNKKDLAIALGEKATSRDVETSGDDVTPSGVYDLAGNVQEWTKTPAQIDGMMIVRGASFVLDPSTAQTAVTNGLPKFTVKAAGDGAPAESVAGAGLGFRCVKST